MKKVIPKGAILVPETAERVFKGEIFEVYQWSQELFDGSHQTFEMLKRDDTVITIGLVDNQLLIIDEEQPHAGSHQSFPGGRIDPEDDSPLAAAQRETLEESGYSFKHWRLIQVAQPAHKIEWFVYVFLAWEVSDVQDINPDPGEKIIVKLKDFEAVKSKAMRGVDYL